MNFGEKLKAARTECGLKQSELAKKLNTTGNTISNWENNVSKPDLETLSYICGILHVTASYFLQPSIPEDEVSIPELKHIKKYRFISKHSPDGAKMVDTVLEREHAIAKQISEQEKQLQAKQEHIDALEAGQQEASEKIQSIRIYTYMRRIACAGEGFYFDDIPTETIEAPYMEGADFIIGVNGDSMEPDYFDGDKVYVKKTSHLNIGDVGIFTVGNECYIKEFGKDGLMSRNKDYPDIPGNADIRVIGKVIGKVPED